MHRILEIAIGVGLGMTIFLVILWILGTAVYICCGKTKKIASVRKLKNFSGVKEVQSPNPDEHSSSESIPTLDSESKTSSESSSED